ncbi:GIY-YIG nuclease family protein [Salinisphaera sp. T5B8]|uniref:GIY-YIG nuclease family protein n=1 Tax=Salinisphaera sp. T5B8 TaxID=1304154 RepID=UPI00333F0CAF
MSKAVVYRITYPNGKIYIGQDRTNSINYFGSADSALIAADFSAADRQCFTITREILWESDTANRAEINRKELELIRTHRANNPGIGYNRWPKFKQLSSEYVAPGSNKNPTGRCS